MSDSVTVVVVTTGSAKPYTDTITGIQVSTKCGVGSTTLSNTKPTLEQFEDTETALTSAVEFTSSNPTCPFESAAITAGDDKFTFETGTLTLKPEFAKVAGTYAFTIVGTFKDGLTATWESSAVIKPACRSTFNTDLKKAYTFFLPETGTATESFPEAATDYVSAPTAACTQQFDYAITGRPGEKDATLILDKTTGLFSLTTDSAVLGEISIVLTVTTKGSAVD